MLLTIAHLLHDERVVVVVGLVEQILLARLSCSVGAIRGLYVLISRADGVGLGCTVQSPRFEYIRIFTRIFLFTLVTDPPPTDASSSRPFTPLHRSHRPRAPVVGVFTFCDR